MAKWDFSKIDKDYCVDEPRLKDLERPKRRDYVVQQEEEELDWVWGGEEVDNVNHPSHYNQSGIECIDAMKAMTEGTSVGPHAAYCWQNSFKYLWRWPYKNGLEDLKKARWYLDRLIEEVEK